MTHVERFGLFSKAVIDCAAIAEKSTIPFGRWLHRGALGALRSSRRFYLPEAVNLLEGKPIDLDIKSFMRLPFDQIAVLSETTLNHEDGAKEVGWKITLAAIPELMPNSMATIDRGFSLIGLTSFRSVLNGMWTAIPGVFGCHLPMDRDGYALGPMLSNGVPGAPSESESFRLVRDVEDDAWSVMNLCVMLGMHNVKTECEQPSARLSKSRIKRGKPELLDYHVLVVDGEKWNSPSASVSRGGDGGVRSHLRRGHIRRLNGGDRRIWVRATYVQGSAPGFVEKDYAVMH